MTTANETVRERIMDHLHSRFLAIEDGADGHIITWNTVERRILTDEEQRMGDALSLLDVSEQKDAEIGHSRVQLQVITEFWIKLNLGDNPSQMLNRIMGDVQRTMLSDVNSIVSTSPLCELTIDIRELRNEFDVDSSGDFLVGGMVVWEVLYRHKYADPTKLPGE